MSIILRIRYSFTFIFSTQTKTRPFSSLCSNSSWLLYTIKGFLFYFWFNPSIPPFLSSYTIDSLNLYSSNIILFFIVFQFFLTIPLYNNFWVICDMNIILLHFSLFHFYLFLRILSSYFLLEMIGHMWFPNLGFSVDLRWINWLCRLGIFVTQKRVKYLK